MTFIEFKRGHLAMMRLSDQVRDILGKYPSGDNLERLAAAGLAFTIVSNGEILGVVGAVPLDPLYLVGEVFVVAAEERHARHVAFVKAVRQILDRARGRFAIIEAVAAEGVPARWFTWLGFKEVKDGRWRLETI